MNYDDEANVGPRRGRGSAEGGLQALDPPPTRLFHSQELKVMLQFFVTATKGPEEKVNFHTRGSPWVL